MPTDRFSLTSLTCLTLAGVVAGTTPAPAQPLMQPNISVALARRVVDAVIAECSRPGTLVTVSVAVVDRAGDPVMQLRADTASPISAELALRKAYTALSVGRPSLDWRDATAGASELAGQRALRDLIPLGGGAPISIDGQRIGAVGVSGAQGGQPGDHACALAGAAAAVEAGE